jgi:hypothetical protein
LCPSSTGLFRRCSWAFWAKIMRQVCVVVLLVGLAILTYLRCMLSCVWPRTC